MRILWLVLVICIVGWEILSSSTSISAAQSAMQASQVYNEMTATFLAVIAITLAMMFVNQNRVPDAPALRRRKESETTAEKEPENAEQEPEANEELAGKVQDFEGDNEGYLEWITEHPDGYVLNLGVRPHTSPDPRINQMLHRATCRHVNNARTSAGDTWKKVCSLDKSALIGYGQQREGQVAAFCGTCRP